MYPAGTGGAFVVVPPSVWATVRMGCPTPDSGGPNARLMEVGFLEGT
jgi:hypothetical protein